MEAAKIKGSDKLGRPANNEDILQGDPDQITPEDVGHCIIDAALSLSGKAREEVIGLLSAHVPAHQIARDGLVKVGLLPERKNS